MVTSANLQPFTGNGDASIWVKNSQVGRETPNTNKNKDVFLYNYWLHERVTWEIVTGAEKTNVDRGEAEIDIGFRGVTISHVTLSCSQ